MNTDIPDKLKKGVSCMMSQEEKENWNKTPHLDVKIDVCPV